jgi:mono/diheme cytochrome c family protein
MRNFATAAALVGIAVVCTTSAALAQAKPPAKVDFGALEYKSSCAVCHGVKGKGDGEYQPWLTKSPTDLTTLAKRNGGVFPLQRVYELIDGRQAAPAHGSRDMPIWGARYSAEASSYYYYAEVPGQYDSEALARTRILALVEYINRLQVK